MRHSTYSVHSAPVHMPPVPRRAPPQYAAARDAPSARRPRPSAPPQYASHPRRTQRTHRSRHTSGACHPRPSIRPPARSTPSTPDTLHAQHTPAATNASRCTPAAACCQNRSGLASALLLCHSDGCTAAIRRGRRSPVFCRARLKTLSKPFRNPLRPPAVAPALIAVTAAVNPAKTITIPLKGDVLVNKLFTQNMNFPVFAIPL